MGHVGQVEPPPPPACDTLCVKPAIVNEPFLGVESMRSATE
jgi:hypothetical protein